MAKHVFMRHKVRLPYQVVALDFEVTALQPLSTQARAALTLLKHGLSDTHTLQQAMGVAGSNVLQKELLQFMLEGLTCINQGGIALTPLGEKVLHDGNRRETLRMQNRYLVDRFEGNRLVLLRNAARSRTRDDNLPTPKPVDIEASMVEDALKEEPRFHRAQIKVTEVDVTQQQFMVVEHDVQGLLDPELPQVVELEVRDRGGRPAPQLTQALTKTQWQQQALPDQNRTHQKDAWKLLQAGWGLEDTVRTELRGVLERATQLIEVKDSRWISTDLVKALVRQRAVRVVLHTQQITPVWQEVVDMYPAQVKLQKTQQLQRLIVMDGHEVARGVEAHLKHQYGGTLIDLMWLNPPDPTLEGDPPAQ